MTKVKRSKARVERRGAVWRKPRESAAPSRLLGTIPPGSHTVQRQTRWSKGKPINAGVVPRIYDRFRSTPYTRASFPGEARFSRCRAWASVDSLVHSVFFFSFALASVPVAATVSEWHTHRVRARATKSRVKNLHARSIRGSISSLFPSHGHGKLTDSHLSGTFLSSVSRLFVVFDEQRGGGGSLKHGESDFERGESIPASDYSLHNSCSNCVLSFVSNYFWERSVFTARFSLVFLHAYIRRWSCVCSDRLQALWKGI